MELRNKPAPGFGSPSQALRYSLAYAVLSGLWIFSSDQLLGFLVNEPAGIVWFQSLKGLVFVGVSTLLLYFLLRKTYTGTAGQGTEEPARPQSSRPIALALVLFSLLLIAGSFAVYRSAQKEIARNATVNLASVAQLKVSQIQAWLADARHDIEQAVGSPEFMPELHAWLKDRKRDPESVVVLLEHLWAAGRFDEAALYDADGRLLLSAGAAGAAERITVDAAAFETRLDDFHIVRQNQQDRVTLGLVRPLRIASDAEPVAWIYVALDHVRWLDSMLRQWPGSSPSAETLLVRREGDKIVYLNTLRHRSGPPLSFSLPMNTPELLAAQLVEGEGGGITGVDYRQVRSLAYGLPVPGTPWFIVAKMDAAEAYANLNMLAAVAATLLATLLSLAAWGIAMRQRRLVASHRREVARLLLAKRYEILVKYANDCIIIIDANHRIIDVNERCQSVYGYRREEMLAMTDEQLLPPGDHDGHGRLPSSTSGSAPLLYEAQHRRRDGGAFPVEISEVVTEIDGEIQIHKIVRDITERKANEDRVAQLSRISNTLSAINDALAHASCLEEVFDTACRACVETAGFKLAWIGLAEQETGALRISNSWGEGLDFLDGMTINPSADVPDRDSLPAIAFREQRICISDDFPNDPMNRRWRDQAIRCGIAASVSLPINHNGIPMGVLTVYSARANFFDVQAEHLLGDIAEGMSFAMHHFAELAAKRETEEALRRREQQLLKAEEMAKLGHWDFDLESGEKIWSPEMYRLFERDPALGPYGPNETCPYFTPETAELTLERVREALNTGERVQFEQELRFPGERTAYHATVIVPVRDEQGTTIALHGTVQDITEQKLNQIRLAKLTNRLAQSAREYEDLYQNAPCGYHSLDKDGVFQRINQTELNWLGYTREEVIGKMKFTDLLPPDRIPGFQQSFPRVIETGELRDLEQNLVRKDGSILPVLINATVIRDEKGRFLMSRSTAYNMTERKKIDQEREDYMRRLTHLSRRLVNMQEEERKRLSASLHDRTSPNLAAIGLNLSIINMSCPEHTSPILAERLEDIRALLEDTTASIREISADLRPPLLDYAGLIPTLESYLYQFSKRTGTVTHFECADFETKASPEVESLLFRITQEALTNCAKHAEATTVDVTLKNENGRIVLCIMDDGTGFDPDSLGKNGDGVGLGMLNMREMTEFAGGRFTIDTSPGKGTTIRIEI